MRTRQANRVTTLARRNVTFANVVAAICLFVVLGGSSAAEPAMQAAARLITGTQIKNNTVTGRDVRASSLTGGDVRDGTLLAGDFKAGQLPVATAGTEGPAGPVGPKGDTGAQGPKGDTGPQGPSGVVMGVSATGGGPNPSGTLQFFGAPVAVTVSSASQRVAVIANSAFGTLAASAGALNLFICYQQPGGAVTTAGHGIINLQLPASTKVPMGLSKVLQLSPGQWTVGMCGTGGAGWSNNDWGTTTALVFTQQ